MHKEKEVSGKFLTYKGKPLVRCEDTIFYGDMSDKYVVRLKIKSTKKLMDIDIPDKVSVQLMSTDPDISARKQVIKTSEKESLYLAMDIADVWLSRALEE